MECNHIAMYTMSIYTHVHMYKFSLATLRITVKLLFYTRQVYTVGVRCVLRFVTSP